MGILISVNLIQRKKQLGAALILFFLVILLTGTIFVVTNISRDKIQVENEEITTDALAKAKEALIAYAVTYYDNTTTADVPKAGMMGFLPCPDDAGSPSEGTSLGTCGAKYVSSLGRLPWKSLGIAPLKDGSGNCLWYAVASEFKNSGGLDPANLNNAPGLSRTEMLNDDSNGSFNLFDKSASQLTGSTAENRAAAVIIAPGKALQGQARSFAAGTQCGNDYDPVQFLEVFNGVDNAILSGVVDALDDFITSDKTNDETFNDRIMTITSQEIFDEIKRRSNFNVLMENTTRELAECVAEFGLSNPSPGGGCDLQLCLDQCVTDRNICLNQCATCRDQCQLDRTACIAAGNRPNVCNQARNVCLSACPPNNSCRPGVCNPVYNACVSNCNATCTPGGGGGGNDFRLPWPAPITLADYRDSQLYVEDSVTGNHLGRLPVDISNSVTTTGNTFSDNYLLESDFTVADPAYTHCRDLNTDILGIVPNQFNSIERRIWQNWKDHFFYAVAGDYVASPANVPTPAAGACANCLTANGGATPYAGIVIFSGERIPGQTRTVLPNDADTKQTITNYLEGNNANNFPDATGNGDYQTGTTNDIAYCINEDMSVIPCP